MQTSNRTEISQLLEVGEYHLDVSYTTDEAKNVTILAAASQMLTDY